jgi:hypothetical protein
MLAVVLEPERDMQFGFIGVALLCVSLIFSSRGLLGVKRSLNCGVSL